jgi:chorismate synthase
MNQFGKEYRLSIFGESHGQCVGIVVDGCPAGVPLQEHDFLADIQRRKSGAKGTTPRTEEDIPVIRTGVFNGFTTGAPIMIQFENKNTRSHDYLFIKDTPRPGHADYVAMQKFGGFEDYRGGGHFSGRLTLGLVAAGVIAKKIIYPATVQAALIEAGGIQDIDNAVNLAIEKKDSIGGIVQCIATNIPVGLGEPFFDSVEAVISHIVFSIPATKGVEFGSGFAAAKMAGSDHNDKIIDVNGRTATNHAGGINGGITNGNDIVVRVAVKPASSISIPQKTISLRERKVKELVVEGRHDTCIALRFPVVLENAVASVLADFMLMAQKTGRVK